MTIKRTITLLAAAVIAAPLTAQTFNKAKMDSLFQALDKNNKAMGSVCLYKDGKEIYSRSIGYSFLNQHKADAGTKYRIGSITKMFTATLVFQLIEEKKLSADTRLSEFFPGLPNAQKITIGNLLNHRSGLHNFTDDEAYASYMEQARTQEQMLDIITKAGADFEPDTQGAYSNSNYIVLGYIIEKILKKPYADVLKSRITDKIGLKNTYYGSKADAAKRESRSYSYNNGWELVPETDMTIPHGAGAIVSTPADLDKFISALFAGKLISAASLEQMKTTRDGYGMGMFSIPFYDKKAYGHNGGIDGFSASLGYFPEDKLAVAYCTNGQHYPANDILIGVLSIYYNKDYVIPAFTSLSLTDAQLDQYTGVYASKDMPLKITISRDKSTLMAQATGQGAFPLEATAADVFRFDMAGIELTFRPGQKEMTLKQNGASYLFTREE
jgi:CubicO group peptidase (beta-lactamase class C family)